MHVGLHFALWKFPLGRTIWIIQAPVLKHERCPGAKGRDLPLLPCLHELDTYQPSLMHLEDCFDQEADLGLKICL